MVKCAIAGRIPENDITGRIGEEEFRLLLRCARIHLHCMTRIRRKLRLVRML